MLKSTSMQFVEIFLILEETELSLLGEESTQLSHLRSFTAMYDLTSIVLDIPQLDLENEQSKMWLKNSNRLS